MGKPPLYISSKMKAIFRLPVGLFCLALGPLMMLGLSSPVLAADVPSLYSAQVAIDESATNPREDANKAALIAVLARVSGSELSSNKDRIDTLFPTPTDYVTQFSAGDDNSLWVSFDGAALEQVLRANGETVWGRDRPLTLVWLAVDWGKGTREVIAAGDAQRERRQSRSIDRNRLLRERVLEIAASRGLPLLFPLLDTTDLQSVTFSDIWGGFDERIIAASARYDANSILIGRVRASSDQRNRWSYVFGDETRSWTGSPEEVIGQIADLLASEFAVGGGAPLRAVTLDVAGVDSVDAYAALQSVLGSVSVIEVVSISGVAGDTVSYQIEIRGGVDRLRRALRFAGLIEQEAQFSNGALQAGPDLQFYINDMSGTR